MIAWSSNVEVAYIGLPLAVLLSAFTEVMDARTERTSTGGSAFTAHLLASNDAAVAAAGFSY